MPPAKLRAGRSPRRPDASVRVDPGSSAHWFEVNQRMLYEALDALRAHIEAWLAARQGKTRAPSAIPGTSWPPALGHLAGLFGLSAFEANVLMLCAAHELDSRLSTLYADVQNDAARRFPTFGLALQLLAGSHWDALTPVGRLRRWCLVEMVGEAALTQNRLALDERVLHYLGGAAYPDPRLATVVRPITTTQCLPEAHRSAAERIVATWQQPDDAREVPIVELVSDDCDGAREIAAAACRTLDLGLREVRAGDLPSTAPERDQWTRLWARESLLLRSALYIDTRAIDTDDVGSLVALLDTMRGLIVVGARAPLPSGDRIRRRIAPPAPSAAEQAALWRKALGPHAARVNGELDTIATHFRLSPRDVAAAGEEAAIGANGDARGFRPALWSACRERARRSLGQLAERIDVKAQWPDLVLPSPQIETLRLIALHARHRAHVYQQWGFGSKSTRGLAVCALFSGATGTGKTMAAEVLANELELDLYRIDLAGLVSKYIGETEKNLARVFDAADASGAILLFDEADALFGRRSEVRDSHDRYANIEVSYLLQRTEQYRGLAILTSNIGTALDPAFMRRLRFIVHFPFPDQAQRREIWRRALPRATPRRTLDYDRLARLDLAGGQIHALALNAAFLAAAANEPVTMRHLRRAAECEFAKLDRPLLDSEVGDWT